MLDDVQEWLPVHVETLKRRPVMKRREKFLLAIILLIVLACGSAFLAHPEWVRDVVCLNNPMYCLYRGQ
jgi:hypothetical protein